MMPRRAPHLFRRLRNTLAYSRRKRVAAIDMTADGFVMTFKRRETRVAWDDITRIEAGVRNYLFFDGLYVVVTTPHDTLELDELDDGFRQFEAALCEHWPQMRDVLNGLMRNVPHEARHELVWQR